jgi:predicted restriction endonuclease
VAANYWTREQLLVALFLYCRIPFGKIHRRNPDIICYAQLIGRTPSALAIKLLNLASLDPVIRNSGRTGMTNVSKADRAMWQEMHTDWEQFARSSRQAIEQLDQSQEIVNALNLEIEEACEIQGEPVSYTGHDRMITTTARVGQSLFRQAVLSAYQNRCCISGLSHPKFLIASHIVPWREDPKQRLNPHNGLCLSVLHDRAFDQGLLTIADDLTVIISSRLKQKPDAFTQATLLAYDGKPLELPGKFQPDAELLRYHRCSIYSSDAI